MPIKTAPTPDSPAGLPASSAPALIRQWRNRFREVGLSVILGLQVVIMFVVAPLAGTGLFSAEVVEFLRFALAATAITVVNRSRSIGVAVGATFVISLICTMLLKTGGASRAVFLINIGITIAFDIAVAWTVAHAAFDAGRITVHRIMGAVILYLYIGLIFAGVFRLAAALLHPAFSGLSLKASSNVGDLLYFSLTTLTTTGFGDIVPVHPFIRSLANLESVIGQLYPATLLARLVTLHGIETTRSGGRGME